MDFNIILIIVLFALTFANLTAVYSLYKENQRLKAELENKQKPNLAIDAQKLLHDLTKGEAVVRIIPLNPEDLFLRSPTR